MTRHTHTEDFAQTGAAKMRDLIDRAALLEYMGRILNHMEADMLAAGNGAYLRGYRSAMSEVQNAARVDAIEGAPASDVEEYALNMKAVAEGLLREIPYGVSDTADDCHASAEAMLEETKQFLAKMGVKEDA